ncbi:MAG: 4-(cytidine 5'-diphospho)-2-C-methyl-D-erythritol kinase [Alphaproteobacteria bacterium]|jgi:4-diphosphocytidyl-2-C-methyl-D-erythritol kinase|nr:4-(cytidine 5'-diphospho)-2-C-methyl-D-erythritol kinase [Alphaproteobacteria bacterium]
MLTTRAPAKINLYLHITGLRQDGYHYLDSLVAFTNIGDTLSLEEQDGFDFAIVGPMAEELASFDPESNLVVRAAHILARTLEKPLNLKLTLTKQLPIASGIGGGSTDAAAALRLLAAHWRLSLSSPMLREIAATLGQDVPCCLSAETCYFRDIGDQTDPGPDLPLTHIVMANPNIAVPTPSVYKARKGAFSPISRLDVFPETPEALAQELATRHNDLTEAAISLCPTIRDVIDQIAAQPGCLLSRMSGSGATCFGLFADRGDAKSAAAALMKDHGDWWVVPAFIPTDSNLPLS